MIPEDLELQIQRMLDGELSKDELPELEAELLGSDECLAAYREAASLHSDLETLHVAQVSVLKANVVPIDRIVARQRKRSAKVALVGMAAIVLLVVSLLSVIQAPKVPLASFQTTPGSEFAVAHGDARGEYLEGQVLGSGSVLELRSGQLEGNFRSGIRFVIQSPATIRVIAPDRVALDRGLAWFEVPPDAVGFTVETPALTIVDLGTEFGVKASMDRQDEVHTFRGLVEVTSHSKTEPAQTLKGGEARRVDESGHLKIIEMADNQFAKTLPTSDGLIGHWEFETESDRMIADSSGNGHLGRLEGAAGIATDPERGMVLQLPPSGSALGVDIDSVKPLPNLSKHRGLTLATWIKVEQEALVGGLYSYALGLGEEGDHPIATLGLLDGRVNAFIEGDGADRQARITGKASLTAGTWNHIAVTFDRVNDVGRVYVNGVWDGATHNLSSVDDGELDWNYAAIGRALSPRHNQRLVGSLDDARIYDRALSDAEIKRLTE